MNPKSALLVCLLCLALPCSGLYFLVYEEKKCYSLEQPRNTPIVFNYEILDTDEVVMFDLYYGKKEDKETVIFHKTLRDASGHIDFVADNEGHYLLCVQQGSPRESTHHEHDHEEKKEKKEKKEAEEGEKEKEGEGGEGEGAEKKEKKEGETAEGDKKEAKEGGGGEGEGAKKEKKEKSHRALEGGKTESKKKVTSTAIRHATRFRLAINYGYDSEYYEQLGKKDNFDTVNLDLRRLNDMLDMALNEADYQKHKEVEHHAETEGMNTAALWWPMLQIAILVLTGVFQVQHLKSFFKNNKLI